MVARVVTIKAAGDRVGQVLDYYAGLVADQLQRGATSRGPVDYYLDLTSRRAGGGGPVVPRSGSPLAARCCPAS